MLLRARRARAPAMGEKEEESADAMLNRGVKRGIRGALFLAVGAAVWSLRGSMRSLFALGLAARGGFLAGFLHVLTGPDHIAGFTALAVNQPVVAAMGLSTLWGFAHVAGHFSVGAVLVLARALGAPLAQDYVFEPRVRTQKVSIFSNLFSTCFLTFF